MSRLEAMENLTEFDAEIFWPFEPFFFANQVPTGKYPIIIQNFNCIEGYVHPIPDTNASWKGYGSHIMLEAFLEAMCTVDFVRLDDFFEDVYERAQDKKAALLRLTECINYGLNQLKIRTTNVEWHYCYWMGLIHSDLKGRTDECRWWIAEKRRGKTKQIVVKGDRSLLELFDNDEKLLNDILQRLAAKRFLIKGKFNSDEFKPGAVRKLLDVLTNKLHLASFDPTEEETGRIFNDNFGYIMDPRNYKIVGKKDTDFEEDMLSWFKGLNKYPHSILFVSDASESDDFMS